MNIPVGFRELCQGLHQDANLISGGSIDKLAADCLAFVPDVHRPDLRAFLSQRLRERTSAELKGDLARQGADIRFTSAGAKSFLEAVNRHLG